MKRIIISGSLILALIYMTLLPACKHDPGYLSDPTIIQVYSYNPDTVYFQNDVLPLLQSNCGVPGCHDAATAEHKVIMTDYVNVTKTGHVKVGNPKGSKLYRVITRSGEEKMPPSSQNALTSQQKDLIYRWIDQGAWNLECMVIPCDTAVFTFSGAVWPTIQLNCMGCHSGSNPGGGILMTNYQEIVAIASEPRFLGAITHTDPYKYMPQSGNMLSGCKIIQISKWIDAGMPND